MGRDWLSLVRDFRKQGKNWGKLNEEEKQLWRDAYKKEFGREHKEPRTLAERWDYESKSFKDKIIRRDEQE